MTTATKQAIIKVFGAWLMQYADFTQEQAQKEIDLVQQFNVLNRPHQDVVTAYAISMPRQGALKKMNRKEKYYIGGLLQSAIEHKSF